VGETFAETEVARFHYSRTGSGPPVVLLPGAGGWRFTFEGLIPVLARRHTVYAIDPPGQGRTEVLDPGFAFDTDAIAGSLVGFLDAVGLERTAIIGHSWGGGFALRLSELHPQRVTRLALIAPGGLEVKDVWEFRAARLPVIGELGVRLTPRISARHMLEKSFAHRDRVPYHRLDDLVRTMRSSHNRAARLRDMLRVERSVTWADTERDLHLADVPVLLLWGDQDRYLPARLIERFTARLPQVDAHVLAGGGHSLHDDCPDQTYALLLPFLEAGHSREADHG
jgi:pimeloyl-ACP methyl ester carboxylesterase